jgi:hypothetical protein
MYSTVGLNLAQQVCNHVKLNLYYCKVTHELKAGVKGKLVRNVPQTSSEMNSLEPYIRRYQQPRNMGPEMPNI